MEKVFNNLLSNAFKFTPNGGSITLSLQADHNGGVRFSVADTGVGIKKENLEHVFERFWQDDQINAAITQSGSGIGLSLVKDLVEMHSGVISVTSIPGQGTTFTVMLPHSPSRDAANVVFVDNNEQENLNRFLLVPEEPRNGEPQDGEQIPTDKGVRMLIVEDNSDMLGILCEIFNPVYEVHTACNGAEGLEVARRIQPDLVLSDIMMPGMSGLEMCSQLKTAFETSHIPVVLLTARNAEEHMVEGLLTGADDYITKPFNVRILMVRCHNIINQRRRLQARFSKAEVTVEALTSNPNDQDLLARATTLVNERLSDPEFDIALFARELGLSRTLLFTKIKGITGQTPSEFIASIRLKQALKRITEEPGVRINEIAYDLGFSSPSYFIRCFRETFGMTPNAWRKDHSSGQ